MSAVDLIMSLINLRGGGTAGRAAKKYQQKALFDEALKKKATEKALVLQQAERGSLAPETMQSNVAVNYPAGSQQAALQEQGQKFSPTGMQVGELFGQGSRQVYSQNDYTKMTERIDQQQKQDQAAGEMSFKVFSDENLPAKIRTQAYQTWQRVNKDWNTGIQAPEITDEDWGSKKLTPFFKRGQAILKNKDFSYPEKIEFLRELEVEAIDSVGTKASSVLKPLRENIQPKKATPTYRTLGGNIYHLQNGESKLVQKGSVDERAITNAMKDCDWELADEAQQAQLIEKHKRFITGKTKTTKSKAKDYGASNQPEGTIAKNPKTQETIVTKGGRWVTR